MKEFLTTLKIFIELYQMGLRITKAGFMNEEMHIYRFFWFKEPLKDFPDIDKGPNFVVARSGGDVYSLAGKKK